jgi:cyanophycin synthetase
MAKVNLKKIENTNILIILQTCRELGIKYQLLDREKYSFRLVKGDQKHRIWKKSLGINSSAGIAVSRDKHKTYLALKRAGLPVLRQALVKTVADYGEKGAKISFPQVIKPLLGEKGRNIYLNIKNKNQGKKVVSGLLKKTSACVVEPYFRGRDYRLMVLDDKVIGFSERRPPVIMADGKRNLRRLIKLENKKRLEYNQKAGRRMFNRMLIWRRIKWYLKQQGLNWETIPAEGKKITLYPLPNFSTGGTVTTIPLTELHPRFIDLAVKTARVIGLTLIGIDIIIKDITQPASRRNCAIIEVNSDPGLRLHDWPNQGKPQEVTEKILKYIFS